MSEAWCHMPVNLALRTPLWLWLPISLCILNAIKMDGIGFQCREDCSTWRNRRPQGPLPELWQLSPWWEGLGTWDPFRVWLGEKAGGR